MGIRSAVPPCNTMSKVRSDSSYFDDVKLSVLRKATTVIKESGSPTIGPLARTLDEKEESLAEISLLEKSGCEDGAYKYCTSTPLSKKNSGLSVENNPIKVVSGTKLFSPVNESPKLNIHGEPTVTRLLIDYEKCRQNSIEDTMRQRVQAMADIENELAHKRDLVYSEWQAQVQSKDLLAQTALLLQLEEEEKLAAERRQQIQEQQELQAKRINQRNERLKAAEQKRKEEEEEKRRVRSEKLKQLEQMQQIQQSYRQQYQAILNFIRSSKDRQAFTNHVSNLKSYNEGMEQLIQHCKENVSAKDIEKASTFLKQLSVVHDDIKAKTEEQQRREEEQQNREEEQQQKESQSEMNAQETETIPNSTEALPASQEKPSSEPRKIGDALADCIDKRNFQLYLELIGNQQQTEESYKVLMEDDSLKKFRFECQKAINIPVNAISPVSAAHLTDKLTKLSRLLWGKPVGTSDTARISASTHPAGIVFCKDLLAKKLVRQGDSTVSSKPEASFAIAAVIVALWQEFPCWGNLVLAHFYNECPYLVPFFKPQLEGQTTKDYYKSLGYRYLEEGEVEKQDKFLKRMSGIMRLYAAVLITNPPRSRSNLPHPHGLQNGWRWIASILNLEPRPDICATLIYDFLEVAGHAMYLYYGRQFQKLLVFLCREYFPLLQKASGSSSGPVVRLETFLQQILREGRIEPPAGTLRPDFW